LLSTEKYYQIIDYNKPVWARVRACTGSREQFGDPDFLSANLACLVGEKGVGKTVLACQKALQLAANDTTKIFYISLDDTMFAADSMYDLAQLAETHGVQVVIFDEVHRYSAWKSELKRIADRLTVRCIVSGSSILSFKDLGGLARRMVKYELLGMTLREYLNMTHGSRIKSLSLDELCRNGPRAVEDIARTLHAKTQRPLPLLFADYLRRGYYAYGVSHTSDSAFSTLLRQATEDTIAYEIVLAQTHSRPDMARKLQSIFKAIAQNVPYTIDYEALKAYAHISDTRTLKHYLACLQDAGIIRSLDRYTLKSLRKPEKLYIGNTALYYAYAELKPDTGSIRETFFLTSMALSHHQVSLHSGQADFAVGSYTFEVGGPRKGKRQIKDEEHSYVVRDTWEFSADPRIIPLWVFGLL